MKFWIAKNSEVSVLEQIVTQIRIGIAGGDLTAGQKLPSTRELARRFGIHPNTVAAAYRQLAAEKLVEARKGSGMFVITEKQAVDSAADIDVLLADFVSRAASCGFARTDIEIAVGRWLNRGNSRKLVVIESDPGLCSIILEEIRSATGLAGKPVDIDSLATFVPDESTVFAALYDEREKITPFMAAGQAPVFLEVNSVANSLAAAARPGQHGPVAIVSGWDQFITFARVYLLAAHIDPDMLMIRSTADADWKKALNAASMVICDSYTATKLNGREGLRVFKLIRDESIEQLRHALV